MSKNELFWKQYIAKTQVDVSIAAYTKVPISWKHFDYVPDFNRLYFILEGEGYLHIDGRDYYPSPGELYLLPAGVRQSYSTISDDTFGKFWCHFTALVGDVPLFRLVDVSPVVRAADVPYLRGKFEELVDWHRRDAITSVMRANAIVLELIAYLIESSETVKLNASTAASLEKMSRVIQYIEAHLADNLTVEKLAQVAHFHPNYFIRAFKNTTGLSPIQYVNRLKMEKAKRALAFTPRSVSEIADGLGLEVSYFSRMFKEYTGFAPTDYRDMHR